MLGFLAGVGFCAWVCFRFGLIPSLASTHPTPPTGPVASSAHPRTALLGYLHAKDHGDVLRLPAFESLLLVLLIWLVALCNTSLPSVVFDPGHLILLWALSRWLVLTLPLSLPLSPLDLRPEITSLPLFLPGLSTFDALVLSWLGLRCLVPVVSIGLRLLAVRRVLCWTTGFPHRTAPLL